MSGTPTEEKTPTAKAIDSTRQTDVDYEKKLKALEDRYKRGSVPNVAGEGI